MSPLIIKDGKLLLNNGKLATNENCCCEETPCNELSYCIYFDIALEFLDVALFIASDGAATSYCSITSIASVWTSNTLGQYLTCMDGVAVDPPQHTSEYGDPFFGFPLDCDNGGIYILGDSSACPGIIFLAGANDVPETWPGGESLEGVYTEVISNIICSDLVERPAITIKGTVTITHSVTESIDDCECSS